GVGVQADAPPDRQQGEDDQANVAGDAGLDAAADTDVGSRADVEAGGVDAQIDQVVPPQVAAEVGVDVPGDRADEVAGSQRDVTGKRVDARPSLVVEGEQIDAVALHHPEHAGGQVLIGQGVGRRSEGDVQGAQGALGVRDSASQIGQIPPVQQRGGD